MLESIIRDLRRTFHGFDDGAFRVALATFIANRIEQRPHETDELIVEQVDPLDPVWMLLVGPPSSGKTEALNMMSGHRDTFEMAEITPRTIASGFAQSEHLLTQMSNKIVLIKDLSGLLSKKEHEVGAIMDQFRQIYDGRVSFAWGSNKPNFDWHGKIGLIAGCTEDIYERRRVIAEMGDRFMYYPVRYFKDSRNRRAVSRAARRNTRRDGTHRRVMRERTHFMIDQLTEETIYEDTIEVPEAVGDVIDTIADLSTRLRGFVPRDFYHRISDPPQLEGPGRMGKVLELMAIAMAVLHQVPEPRWEHVCLIRKAAFGGSKPMRREIVLGMVRASVEGASVVPLADIVRWLGKPRTTVERTLDDLEALGVIRSFKYNNNRVFELTRGMGDGFRMVLELGRE